MNLAVAVPISWDYVPTPFLIGFQRLFKPTALKKLRDLGVERYVNIFNRSFPLDVNRNELVKKALELDAEWILFLDADMTHPPELLPALVEDALKTNAAIVSAVYYKKEPPHAPVPARFATPDDPQLMTPVDVAEKGLFEADVVGMGAALVHTQVFEEVSRPWFEYEIYEQSGERTVTEDVPFCKKAKKEGFRIVVDTRLVCGHVKQVEVDETDFMVYRSMIADRLVPPGPPVEGS